MMKRRILLVALFLSFQNSAEATSYYRRPKRFENEYFLSTIISSPALVAVDGNWSMLAIEAGTLFPTIAYLKYAEGRSAAQRTLAEEVATPVIFSAVAFHMGYPFWSLLQGQLASDQGRIMRSLPVAGLMLFGIAAQIQDLRRTRTRTRIQDYLSLEVAPWPGKDLGVIASFEF